MNQKSEKNRSEMQSATAVALVLADAAERNAEKQRWGDVARFARALLQLAVKEDHAGGGASR